MNGKVKYSWEVICLEDHSSGVWALGCEDACVRGLGGDAM